MNDSAVEKKLKQQAKSVEENIPDVLKFPNSNGAKQSDELYNAAFKPIKPDHSCLIVGDTGVDAIALLDRGISNVTSTNLESNQIKFVRDHFGKDFSVGAENAEKLSYAENEFDWVICKESYHHFPRPPVAFYEFLRVAKKGVIFIEPLAAGFGLKWYLRACIKSVLRGQTINDQRFEVSGNYVFGINLSEVYQMVTALEYKGYNYKYVNSTYLSKYSLRDDKLSRFIYKTVNNIQNAMTKLRLIDPGLVILIISSDPISGYSYVKSPKNPFS